MTSRTPAAQAAKTDPFSRRARGEPFGLVVLNKPPGITSRQALDLVADLLAPVPAGHAGTLDPLASGVLVACVGQATRLIEFVQRMNKSYRAEFLLGRTSDTDDVEGQVIELPNAQPPSLAAIEAALPSFVGRIEQRPPAYSAIKVQGRRAYDLARRGKEVQLPTRPVTIESLQVTAYEYPRLALDVRCGSGTYIRSLGRDLGAALGGGAVLAALERTAIGPFSVERGIDPRGLDRERLLSALLPAQSAFDSALVVRLDDEQIAAVARGRFIHGSVDWEVALEGGESLRAGVDGSGRLVAVLCPRGEGRWGPYINFTAIS